MATATLIGTWLAPDLTPRSGRIIATAYDPRRVGSGVIGGSSVGALSSGALPTSGPGAVSVTVPATGQALYDIRERLNDVPEQTYRIAVVPGDTVIDLTNRP